MTRSLRSGLALAALAAATTIAVAPVAAAPAGKQQRIMLEQKHRFGSPSGTFTLSVLTRGRLLSDVGTYTYAAVSKPWLDRGGQRVAVYVAVATLTGARGTFVVRWRVEYAGAGDGITVGTGTWTLVRGTGAYAGATGRGRLAAIVVTTRGQTSTQFEGLVRSL